ncbi:hypothetical protein CCR87_00645, partial [Rhodobaculum claviforme]|nr:hypothetical protein [Rhodobaculum claviforme]
MVPDFALTLSHEGVALLHRTPRGWLSVGDVALNDPALDARLAALRDTGLSLAPAGQMLTKLVIPDSEILYTEVTSPGPDPLLREAAIRVALQGATPYAVEDLVFDWSGNGERVRVAVVARQTLVEAEAFADSHGFGPVCLVARPAPGAFPGEPWFGRTSVADTLIGPDAEVLRDIVPIEVVGRAAMPAATVKAIFARSAAVSRGLGQTPPRSEGAELPPTDADAGGGPGTDPGAPAPAPAQPAAATPPARSPAPDAG